MAGRVGGTSGNPRWMDIQDQENPDAAIDGKFIKRVLDS
jgi:hypothetical protein